jgi:transcriptional regulator with XRE-family HTH domain
MKHPLEDAYNACATAYEQSRMVRSIGRKTFANQLRETRRTLKLTVRELGDKIGVTGSLINQIEVNSKSILKKEQVDKIISLCTSFSKSKKVNTTSESVPTQQEVQPPCTSEENLSQIPSETATKNWNWPPSDFNS